MDEMVDCPRCNGTGWLKHDAHCPECDGTGMVEEDPFFIKADLIYEEMKDRLLDDAEGV